MPVVIKLRECEARPAGEGDNTLLEHLLGVAGDMGDPGGNWEGKIFYLAGLLHDAGKARARWQEYMKKQGNRGDVVHSPLGSALFFYTALRLIDQEGLKGEQNKEARLLAARLSRDIASHHGKLGDLEEGCSPWASHRVEEHARECDLGSLMGIVEEKLGLVVPERDILEWLKRPGCKKAKCEDDWIRVMVKARSYVTRKLGRSQDKAGAAAEISLPTAAGLISADRYHAAGLREHPLAPGEARGALARLQDNCGEKAREAREKGLASEEIIRLRQDSQGGVCRDFKAVSGGRFFGLALPTGAGKTITSLRLALESSLISHHSRIIYIAPYLAILSQAAGEVAGVTGLEVMQHHHLSLVEHQDIDDAGFLALESWQAPVVATTFNQLFMALFPATAQQAIRPRGLRKSFVIIDEPQVIDTQVWNVFLRMLKAAAVRYDFKVLFVSATIPPLEEGLGEGVHTFSPEINLPARYKVIFAGEKLDQEGLAARIIEESQDNHSIAAILNTVKDAYLAYRAVKSELGENNSGGYELYFLSGQMTPIHKARRIADIRNALEEKQKKVIVISTQILEAGVDLSFRKIYRAVPVIPSIAQTAGRGNRHGEGPLSEIIIFYFLRDGEKDSRKHIYQCPYAREITDSILGREGCWREEKTAGIVREYYRELFQRNPQTACYRHLEQAALGIWSEIARIGPYDDKKMQIEVFVPWGEGYLTEKQKRLLDKFAPSGAQELYQKYISPGFMHSLNFLERKTFMSLVSAFSVSLFQKDAYTAVDVTAGRQITKIKDISLYQEESGMAHLLGGRDTTSRII